MHHFPSFVSHQSAQTFIKLKGHDWGSIDGGNFFKEPRKRKAVMGQVNVKTWQQGKMTERNQ
jgi:hypothetical protein